MTESNAVDIPSTTNLDLVGRTVAFLMIEHKHGTDTDVYASEASARAALRDYVDDWWAREMRDPKPETITDEDVAWYFENVEGEYGSIIVTEVRL